MNNRKSGKKACKQKSEEAIRGKLISKNMSHRFEGNILLVQNRFGGMQDHSTLTSKTPRHAIASFGAREEMLGDKTCQSADSE